MVINEVVPALTPPNEFNEAYLATKAAELGLPQSERALAEGALIDISRSLAQIETLLFINLTVWGWFFPNQRLFT